MLPKKRSIILKNLSPVVSVVMLMGKTVNAACVASKE